MKLFVANPPAHRPWGRLFLPLLLFFCLAAGLWIGSERLAEQNREEQRRMAEEAVRRAAVQCYALEGSYPPSLDYLVKRYGLQVDRERYIVHYQPVGGNLLPQIHLLHRDEKGGE